MRIRHLIAFLLVVGLGATGAMAATWTVNPTTETYGTGTTTYDVKTGGPILAYGGATTGTTRKEAGFFKFDMTSIPDTTVPTQVSIHYYVNDTNYPWYSITPVSLDPNFIGSSAALLWDDIVAEATVGYYNYLNEGSTFAPGWKFHDMGGTAVADVTASLAQDWFSVGLPERDGTATFYLVVDGNTDVNLPYLVVSDDPLYEPPTGLTCVENGLDVDLTWVNGPTVYDSIEVYEGATLLATLAGTDTTYTVLNVTPGEHCYTVCGIVNLISYCSAECCLTYGTCDDVLIDLGTVGCPGTLTASGDTTTSGDYCEDLNGDDHYMFEVTAAGTFEISLCSNTWDTRLYLYDDMCCGNEIGYDDDACATPDYELASVITLDLFPGTYYVLVGGYGSNEGAYDLSIDCLASTVIPPTDLTCSTSGTDATLAWTNGEVYDSIDVYQDDVVVATLGGTATGVTVSGVAKGYHCYYVCGVIATVPYCSNTCCMVQGYDEEVLLWDFEADDGGFVTDGTTGWQWGVPTYGPCAGTADGNVWGTNLDGNYENSWCLLLDGPGIDMGPKGGFVCIDHCYDTEFSWDGGTVWFSTNGGLTYENVEPLGGYPDDALVATGCAEAAGYPGFTGDSLGWVTDCWELTADDYLDGTVNMRFAFGTDGSINGYTGWMIDNITVFRNVDTPEGYSCDYVITPLSGTVPFSTYHTVTFTNDYTNPAFTRRIAATIRVTVGNGTSYSSWKGGQTNVAVGTPYNIGWPVNIPGLATVLGNNTFHLESEDVTPPPYNQPPFPPSGETCTVTNVVVANAP